MRVMVTGGAGFIGSHIVDRLIELNHDVCIVDNLSIGKEENINKGARFYKYDITNLDAMMAIFNFERPDVLMHHAAQINVQASLEKPNVDAYSNILGTINVLQCCIEYGTKKIIYPSSASVYGDPQYLPIDEKHPIQPISFYGISKHTPEHYIKAYSLLYGLKYTIFRYANVYGPRQDAKGEGGVVSIFIDKMLNNKTPVIYGDGEQTRDFVYVKDVVEANVLAMNRGDNEIINISTCRPVSINELYNIIQNILENKACAKYSETRKGDIKHSYLTNKMAEKILGWNNKYLLNDGLKETILYKNL
jgi:UDP-glucose 4-epimerase